MTSVTPPPAAPPPSVQAQPQPAQGQSVEAQIVKLPDNLATTDRAITLRGEVTSVSADGTVRIATARGPVDVKFPEGQIPARGQIVEIEIPQGAPASRAAITLPQPPATQPAATQTATQIAQIQNALMQPQPAQPSDDATVSIRLSAARTQNTAAQANSALPVQSTVTPQTLMAVLKETLGTILKTPLAATPAQTAQAQTAGDTRTQSTQASPTQNVFIQKPLVTGQLARLTPLFGQAFGPASVPQPFTAQTTQALQNQASTAAQSPQASSGSMLQTAATQGVIASASTAAPALNPSLSVDIRVVSIVNPATATNTGAISPQATAVTPLAAAAPNPQGIISAGLGTPQTTNPSIQTQQTQTQVPTTAAPVQTGTAPNVLATSQSATSPVITASYAGQTPQGLPILAITNPATGSSSATHTTSPLMVLQFPASNLGQASMLQLEILPQVQNPTAINKAGLAAQAIQTATTPWAALDDIVSATRAEPQGPQILQALQNALPKPGGVAFTAPVLIMAAAIRQGDIAQWIGEKTADLVKATRKADVLAKLGNDMAASPRDITDSTKTEWRSQPLPMLGGQELHRIELYTRSFTSDEKNQQGQKKTGTRFVMDLALSRMGDMQIDGFSVERKLDVTLRTVQPFSPAMREDLRARYQNALGGIGFAGELNFNASPHKKGWVVFDAQEKPRTHVQV